MLNEVILVSLWPLKLINSLLLSMLLFSFAFSQTFTGKFQHVTKDGQELILVLQEEGPRYWGYLMLTPGIMFTFNHDREQSTAERLIGSLETDDPISFEAFIRDEGLELTLAGSQTMVFEQLSTQGWLPDDELLLQMLSFVPDSPLVREGFPMLSYVNLWTLTEAQGLAIKTQEDYERLGTEALDQWLMGLRRVKFGDADLLQMAYLRNKVNKMPATVGFSLFEIEAKLSSARLSELVLAAAVSPEDLQTPLVARGFEVSDVEGYSLYHRFEDNQMDFLAVDIADLFGGYLGRAARIAVADGFIINAPATEQSINMLESHLGKRPSLADAADIRSLVEALEPYGTLAQAGFFNPLDIGFIYTDPSADLFSRDTLDTPAPDIGSLPFYGLVLLADIMEKDAQVTLWALLYDNLTSAEQAVAVLPERLEASFLKMGDVAPELIVPSISQSEDGMYVVTFGARDNLLAPGDGKSALDYWFTFMIGRDFQLLAIGP